MRGEAPASQAMRDAVRVHSADDWESVLKPVVVRYKGRKVRLYFRGDAAFASPELYDYLNAEDFLYAIRWTRLSCRRFRDNAVRLQLHALAYNLANFMRTLALPKEVEHRSLTTLREKLVKIGAKVVRHGRYVTFQLAEVAVPRELFRKILSLMDDLRRRPVPA